MSLISSISSAATGLAGLLLVTPQVTGYQPQSSQSDSGIVLAQVPTLLFNYEGENTASIQSDITDHYVENNSAIQDMISLKPEEITVQGFVGELNDIAPAPFASLQAAANKLTSIPGYLPGLSATALIAYNTAVFGYETAANLVNSAVSAWSSITGGQSGLATIGSNGLATPTNNNQSKQALMFQSFYGYWQQRILFSVQTPWAIFQNMAIKSLKSIQDPETLLISSFEVTFKMMRFASTQTASITSLPNGAFNSTQGQLFYQSQSGVNLGTQTPGPAGVSFASLVS